MNPRIPFTTFLLTFVLALSLSGCAKVSLSSLTGKPASGGSQKSGAGGPTDTPSQAGANSSAPLEGYWTIAFKFADKVGHSSVQIHQQGNQLSGSGTDDDSARAFNISGTVNGQEVSFVKQYEVADAAQQVPPVQYVGQLQMVNDKDYQGPYLKGQYNTTIKGQQVSSDWEAEMSSAQGSGGDQAAGSQQGGGQQGGSEQGGSPPPQAPAPGKAPDLSGKWKVAYKSNFKTIKGTMFLEQDGDHLTGRGVDKNTNEKFEVSKGWYAFPKITIVRTYKKGKDAAADRTVQFKGKVEWVNDKDYQGPYLHGETQGGGDWEAQLVR